MKGPNWAKKRLGILPLLKFGWRVCYGLVSWCGGLCLDILYAIEDLIMDLITG
jgi:hypothetical protein